MLDILAWKVVVKLKALLIASTERVFTVKQIHGPSTNDIAENLRRKTQPHLSVVNATGYAAHWT
jgi:hypothetical protein